MKKMLLVGKVGCGKTTLMQKLMDLPLSYKKTQALEAVDSIIDSPGEYMERKSYFHALLVASVDVDVIALIIDCTDENSTFMPGMNAIFPCEIIGIVTKTDLANHKKIENAKALLDLAGAKKIFSVSPITESGISELKLYLSN